MFTVSAITGTGPYTIAHSAASNTSASFLSAYNTNAQLMTYTSTTYFVGDTARTNLQGAVIPALFRTTLNGTTEELVEGVENMQLQYGLDTDNNQTVDSYVTAAFVTAANWHNVVSLRLDLLVNSVDGISPSPVAYSFNGATTTPTDRLLRREFLTVINLRNNSQ
jgi:type IV pilus assembly protein PilW